MTTVDTRVEGEALSATGGSARSQADELQERSWKPRPRVAMMMAAASFVMPVCAALVAVHVAARVVRRPAGIVPLVIWIGGLVVLAAASSSAVDRLSRRLLPIAAMLRLSLVFPDQAPSRFAVTLKTGSGKSLERALKRAETDKQFSTSEHAAALVVGLIGSVRAHDRLTRGHCERVRAYADLIGEELGLDTDSRNKLHWAALLHDAGKLDVPAEILNKTERLTSDEWQIIRGHPAAGTRWIEPLRPWLGDWVLAASEHHERYDGDGYPLGLRGEEISLAGRIVAVADAFDVMTAARSYKKALPAAQARVELANNAGTQFDPKVVRAFLAISLGRLKLVMGPLAWLTGLSGSFSLGGATSAVAAGVTAAAVTATAFVAPTAASTARHDARQIAASAASASGSPVSASPGAANPSTPGGAGGAADRKTTDTVPVNPIDDPSDTGRARDTPSRNGSPAPTDRDGGTRTTPTPTTTDPRRPTPTTTPATTPGATPITVPPTTPTTTPGVIAHLATNGPGNRTSAPILPLGTTAPTVTTLPNYDTNRDAFAGLLLAKGGGGASETDPTKYQTWSQTRSSDLTLSGNATLKLWSAIKDFKTNTRGSVTAFLQDCSSGGACTTFDTAGLNLANWSAGSTTWVERTIDFGPVSRTIASGRSLRVKIIVEPTAGDDMWFAYDTNSYPSALRLT